VIASSSCSVMAVRSDDHLRQRHERYLHSDLLVATLRSNREVASSFYKRRVTIFSSTHHPTRHNFFHQPTTRRITMLLEARPPGLLSVVRSSYCWTSCSWSSTPTNQPQDSTKARRTPCPLQVVNKETREYFLFYFFFPLLASGLLILVNNDFF
jgi:hypothetical protein